MPNANVDIFYQCKDCGAIQPPRGYDRPGSSTRQKPIRFVEFRCPDCCKGPAQYFRNAVEDQVLEDFHVRGEYRDGLSSKPGLYGANQPYGRSQQRTRARIFDEMPNGNGRSHHPFSGSSGGETHDEGHFQPSLLRESQATHLYDDDDDAHFDYDYDHLDYGHHRSQVPPGYVMAQPRPRSGAYDEYGYY
ncbi:unnamed protein product [Fusarium langsethiae]|nr:unnamed protein product [Fusarium langsethiae]